MKPVNSGKKKPAGGKVIMTPEKRAAINNQKRALDKKTNMDRRRKPKQSY